MNGLIIGGLLFAGLCVGWLVGHCVLMFRDDGRYDLFWEDDE